MAGVRSDRPILDVDFTLAIHNRTGKYFIGRDMIALLDGHIGRVYYGLLPLRRPPEGATGKVLARLQRWQIMSRVSSSGVRWPPRPRTARPLLHLDPFTVPTAELRPSDAVLCHDVGPLTHSDLYTEEVCVAYRAIYEEIARIGPHVVFVSNASRHAFHQLWPKDRLASSRVIYPPLRTDLPQIPAAAVPLVTGPFLLTVGSLGARKNQARCIAAFHRSGLAHRGVQYVVCGAGEPGIEAVTEAARRTPGVVLLPYIADSELAWLYRNADGFVLASLLEGFGIPLAEAIANSLVPIVSRDSVLDEVAGPGALTVDPLDERDIARAMTTLVEMDVAERKSRLVLLEDSIRRFDSTSFQQGWSALFAEIGSRRP